MEKEETGVPEEIPQSPSPFGQVSCRECPETRSEQLLTAVAASEYFNRARDKHHHQQNLDCRQQMSTPYPQHQMVR